MSHHTRVAKPNDCWICSYSNPSYVSSCDRCREAVTPTSDSSGRAIEWTVFTFSSDATVPERSSFLQFNEAMKVLDAQERVAICLSGTQSQRYILVRYTQDTYYSYRLHRKKQSARTVRWSEATDQQRELLFHFVNKNSEGAEGESDLLRVF